MKNRIEQLFSPERLQTNWEKAQDRPGIHDEVLIPASQTENPKVLLQGLKVLINERYPEGRGEAVRTMMADLEDLFAKRFPEGAGISESDKVALNADIEEALISMEDLIDALNLGERKR